MPEDLPPSSRRLDDVERELLAKLAALAERVAKIEGTIAKARERKKGERDSW
jgi:hypothetical protein